MSVAIDPGLQPQRTVLAWRRTGMAFLVCGGLILRSGIEHKQLALDALGVMLLLTTAAVAVFGHHRERTLMEQGVPSAPPFVAIALVKRSKDETPTWLPPGAKSRFTATSLES